MQIPTYSSYLARNYDELIAAKLHSLDHTLNEEFV